MNLLQFLTSLFSNPESRNKIFQLLGNILNGNFNLAEILSNLNIEKALSLIAPLFQSNNTTSQNKNDCFSLSPIENFANKDIVYSLNKYFESN
jgi:hypothetical protein